MLMSPALAGCVSPGGGSRTHAEIADVLGQQAAAWNAGDIGAFMRPYWHSPDLTFSSGGRVTRGWEPTLESYRKRYPTRATMGHLTFSNLEITELGGNAALVLGRWRLEREEPIGGTFTLVWRRLDGRWVIVHDHTSRDAP
jgi:beta-aspartyl-peptidase (threonine type)